MTRNFHLCGQLARSRSMENKNKNLLTWPQEFRDVCIQDERCITTDSFDEYADDLDIYILTSRQIFLASQQGSTDHMCVCIFSFF